MTGSFVIKSNKNHFKAGFLFFGISLILAAIGITNNIYLVFILFFIGSIIREYLSVYILTNLMEESPNHLKGTVKGLSEIFNNLFILVSIFSINYLFSLYTPNISVIFYSILFFMVFIIWCLYYKENIKNIGS